ncbi:hypothetical protein CLU95_1534 [Variovorax sp. 54]|nr:hypothetical protein CLU95_1534 [Variovorax sp. 54]
MQMSRAFALIALVLAGPSIALADAPFTGKFSGTGRACSGGLYVRTKTIEWNSSFSICKPARYEVLDNELDKEEGERIAFRLRSPSRHCLYKVVEVQRLSTYSWDVRGYQSMESYRNRALPDWANSPLEERLIMSCPMTRLD